MEERIGFVGIVIEDLASVSKVNAILSQYQNAIHGRIGIPDHQTKTAVIGLIIQCSTETAGTLTGKLGNIHGVTVKSAMTNKSKIKKEM